MLRTALRGSRHVSHALAHPPSPPPDACRGRGTCRFRSAVTAAAFTSPLAPSAFVPSRMAALQRSSSPPPTSVPLFPPPPSAPPSSPPPAPRAVDVSHAHSWMAQGRSGFTRRCGGGAAGRTVRLMECFACVGRRMDDIDDAARRREAAGCGTRALDCGT